MPRQNSSIYLPKDRLEEVKSFTTQASAQDDSISFTKAAL